MKKLLLYITTCFGLTAFAQTPILTQSNHAPSPGFSYVSIDCDTANTSGLLQTNAVKTGSLTFWDFTSLSVNTNTNSFTVSSYTDAAYAPANVLVSSNNDTYSESNISYLKLISAVVNINGFNATLTYTSPAVLANYPMTFSTNISTPTGGNINGSSGTFIGNCAVHYDGTGSLMLPGRSFSSNIARINTIQSYTYNASGFISGDVKSNTFDYYDINLSRVPILSITTTTVNNVQTFPPPTTTTNAVYKFITVLKDYQYVGIKELENFNISVNAFPNPATNFVNITTESTNATKLLFTDIAGRVLYSDVFKNGKVELNTSNYSSGTYIYQVFNKDNQLLYSDKINISR